MSFENLNLIEPIKKALKAEGYSSPTPIQQQAIPAILKGKDLLGCAQTGTGKTAAFALPIIQLLTKEQHTGKTAKKIRTLILTPTRELAIQISESFNAYGKFTRIDNAVIFGGVNQGSQTKALQRGTDVLIATPGRLLDLMKQGFVNLQHLEIFVLDEADRMLDMGFINDVRRVLKAIPEKRQTLFFSATMPPEIVKLSEKILTNPVKVEVTPASSTADTIQQSVYFVDKANKKELLLHVLKDKSIETALVFTRTKHGADKVTRVLRAEGIKADAIHGNKSQNSRQNALRSFKNKETRVLVATDIAARGIDVDELSHVINYEIPNIPETYVHRIGRTGRAGLNGISISFCDYEEKAYLRDINKLIARQIPVVNEHPFPMEVFEIPVKEPRNHSGRNGSPRNSSPEQGNRKVTPGRTSGKGSRDEARGSEKGRYKSSDNLRDRDKTRSKKSPFSVNKDSGNRNGEGNNRGYSRVGEGRPRSENEIPRKTWTRR